MEKKKKIERKKHARKQTSTSLHLVSSSDCSFFLDSISRLPVCFFILLVYLSPSLFSPLLPTPPTSATRGNTILILSIHLTNHFMLPFFSPRPLLARGGAISTDLTGAALLECVSICMCTFAATERPSGSSSPVSGSMDKHACSRQIKPNKL